MNESLVVALVGAALAAVVVLKGQPFGPPDIVLPPPEVVYPVSGTTPAWMSWQINHELQSKCCEPGTPLYTAGIVAADLIIAGGSSDKGMVFTDAGPRGGGWYASWRVPEHQNRRIVVVMNGLFQVLRDYYGAG